MIQEVTSSPITGTSSLSKDRSDQTKTEQVAINVICNECKKSIPKHLTCSQCKVVFYCNATCQKSDWKVHKLICILTPFKTDQQKIGDQDILVYSLDPNYPLPKNSLFELSDLAEMVGVNAMSEFERQLTKQINTNPSLKNSPFPVASSQIQKLYTGPLSRWINEAELNSPMLSRLTTLKAFVEKFFSQPGHEALKVEADDLLSSIRFLHEEMLIGLWQDCIHQFPDYKLKKIPEERVLELNCIAFAFLTAGEKNFDLYPHSNLSDLLKNLKNWNYTPVTEPQIGDFIVYFNAITKEPTHIAILTQSGKALSKPGLRYPFAVEHPLSHISTMYGKGGLAFFRKGC